MIRQGPGPLVTRPRLVCCVIVACLLAGVFPTRTPVRAESPSRPLLEAGFITKFPLFVTWPDEPWKESESPFVIGVMGETPVREHLEELARYATIEGSALEVRTVHGPDEARQCQLLFIAKLDDSTLTDLLARLTREPVLTVADTRGYAKKGVHINFFADGEYVRFEINQETSDAADLHLGFRLKNVARLVN